MSQKIVVKVTIMDPQQLRKMIVIRTTRRVVKRQQKSRLQVRNQKNQNS